MKVEIISHSSEMMEGSEIEYDNDSSLHEALIKSNYGNIEEPTILKESHIKSLSNKSNMQKMGTSRKLELSRSLDNATNIINKLQ